LVVVEVLCMQKKQVVRAVIVLVVLAGGGFAIRSRFQSDARAATGKDAAAAADRVIPVLAATVAQQDVPIYLDGLGTVTAFNTVTVKPQVDGRLEKVVFREGQEVKKGDLLAQIDPRPFLAKLHQAEATLARDRAQLRGHKQALDRGLALTAEGLATQQQVDDARAAADQDTATLQSDQALIESAQLDVNYARIVAPADGVTGVRLIDAGNIVHTGDATGLVVIAQLDPITVLFTLPQDELPRITASMATGVLHVEALSRDGEKKLAGGDLVLVDNQINATTGTIKLKATFANHDKALWPNQFVKARLLLTTRKGAKVVPASVIQRGPQGTFAYVIGEGDKVQVRPVTIESTEGDHVLIASGIEVGDRIVVEGQSQLRPGARVSVKPAGGGGPPAGNGAPAGSASGAGSAGKPGDAPPGGGLGGPR
jgi:multidrug efflux system membrane fusion protein